MSSSDIAQFPNITVLLEGAVPLSISGEDYLFPLSDGCYSMGVVGKRREAFKYYSDGHKRSRKKRSKTSLFLVLSSFSLLTPFPSLP